LDIATALRKYVNRFGKNSRGPAEDERDMLKIAHYACVAYMKMQELKKPEPKEKVLDISVQKSFPAEELKAVGIAPELRT
jgi:hypothetical protein